MLVLIIIGSLCFCGCTKNETNYIYEAEGNGLAILSNKGNNILTAFINNKFWRTDDRIFSFNVNRGFYELKILKLKTSTPNDTLVFTWEGLNNDLVNPTKIELKIRVDSNFKASNFNPIFNNKRIIIDSNINGYFRYISQNQIISRKKGNGVILFTNANFKTENVIGRQNNMNGLLQANIDGAIITNARFDHDLNESIVTF